MKINSFLLRCTLIAALGGFLFGFETAVISGAEKTIQKLWSLSDFLASDLPLPPALFGTVIGSLIAGWPAQRYGRKKVLLVIAVMYLVICPGLFTYIQLGIVYHVSVLSGVLPLVLLLWSDPCIFQKLHRRRFVAGWPECFS